MQAILVLTQPEATTTRRHVQAMIEEDLKYLLEPQRARLSAHQRDGVDREGILQGGALIQLLEHRLRVEAVLHLDHQAKPVDAVGQVLHRRDALQAPRAGVLLDLLDDLLRPHHVGQLGDNDAHLARRHPLDLHLRPRLERAAPRLVGLLDTVQAHDDPALGQVRAGNVAHQVGDARRGMIQEVNRAGDGLAEIVRRDVGGHAHRDARRAVDQELGERGGQHVGLHELIVVVGHEVDGVLIQTGHEIHSGGGHARLRVTRSRRAVVQGTEVAVPVHQGNPQVEGLGEAHQGLVNRGIAVRVELAHDLADDALRLHVSLVGA